MVAGQVTQIQGGFDWQVTPCLVPARVFAAHIAVLPLAADTGVTHTFSAHCTALHSHGSTPHSQRWSGPPYSTVLPSPTVNLCLFLRRQEPSGARFQPCGCSFLPARSLKGGDPECITRAGSHPPPPPLPYHLQCQRSNPRPSDVSSLFIGHVRTLIW